jgi:hypothetical protein
VTSFTYQKHWFIFSSLPRVCSFANRDLSLSFCGAISVGIGPRDLSPLQLQGESLYLMVPRVETRLKPGAKFFSPFGFGAIKHPKFALT